MELDSNPMQARTRALVIAAIMVVVQQQLEALRPIGRALEPNLLLEGEAITKRILGNPTNVYTLTRLKIWTFNGLLDRLVGSSMLQEGRTVSAAQKLLIFLRLVSHNELYSDIALYYAHSLHTVSMIVHEVLKGLIMLYDEVVKLPTNNEDLYLRL